MALTGRAVEFVRKDRSSHLSPSHDTKLALILKQAIFQGLLGAHCLIHHRLK
jgi:hypothetical protein